MLCLEIAPGNNVGLSNEAVVNDVELVAFFDEPDSGTLGQARDAVESVDGHCKIHVGIEFLKLSRNVLLDLRDLVVALEDLSEDRENIDVLVVLRIPLKYPEQEQASDSKMDADYEAYDGRENLEHQQYGVNYSFDYLPDKARSLHRESSNDDFPVIDTGIDAVIDDRDGDDRDPCEDIGSCSVSAS